MHIIFFALTQAYAGKLQSPIKQAFSPCISTNITITSFPELLWYNFDYVVHPYHLYTPVLDRGFSTINCLVNGLVLI